MKIAIMGYGVVGSGVGEVIIKNQSNIAKKAGEEIEIKYILDLRDFPDSNFKCFIKDFNTILNDPEIGVVVEVMGGVNPAYDFSKKLLLAGKHVVTSNKELVAKHGTELISIARDKNINYMFEASVGGGIPIIRPLISCITADHINHVIGILNGTTNYILTQMFQNGTSFEDALKDAQQKGYAEKDPTADIEGIDACRKIAILASLSYGKYVNSEKIPTEGITKITSSDMKYAEKLGYTIKLLGTCEKSGDGVFARVFPAMLSKENLLSNIDGVFNGIMIQGNALGDAMFYGKGAGKLPTASAVVSDIVDVVKHKNTNIRVLWEDSDNDYLLDGSLQKYQYYLRISGNNISDFSQYKTIVLPDNNSEFAIITNPLTSIQVDNLVSDKKIKVLGKLRLVK